MFQKLNHDRYHVSMLLVLNSFIKNLLMTKSRACKFDLVKGQASRPYKRTGRNLLLITCRVTSSEAQRLIFANIALAAR